MSFDDKTDKMNWKDESVWILISIASGLLLSFLYIYFQRFPDSGNFEVGTVCCIAFYALSIFLRIHNHRGQALTGKPAFDETKLKFVFPIFGFAVGIAVLLY